MNNVKKFLGVFVCMVSLLMPIIVSAETDVFEKFKTYKKDGKEYLDIQALEPVHNSTNYCNTIYKGNEDCDELYLFEYINIFLKYKHGIDPDYSGYNYSMVDDKIVVTYCPRGNQVSPDCKEKEFYVEWQENNNETDLDDLLSELKFEYEAYGETHVSMGYHINEFDFYSYKDEMTKTMNYDLFLSHYEGFKEIIEEYPDYEFVLIPGPSGGGLLELNGGAMVGVIKDDVLLYVDYIDFIMNNVLFVPDNGNENLINRAESLLKSYFSNKEKIKITKDETFGLDTKDLILRELKETIDIDKYLGDPEDTVYDFEYVTIEIGDSILNNFAIVSIPKEKHKQLKVKSKDKKTKVSIISENLDVPIDIKIKVEDKKDNEEINKNAKENNIKLEEIFDINLERRYDGSFIEQTPLGVEVYIPVSNYKENDKVNIYYIKDNAVQDEKIEGIVVRVDNKLYAKFIAKHFSTYAVGKSIFDDDQNGSELEEVPNTFDGMTNNILTGTFSLIGLMASGLYIKSKKNKVFKEN